MVEAAFAADPDLRERLLAMRADARVLDALHEVPAPAELRRAVEAVAMSAMSDTVWTEDAAAPATGDVAGVIETLPLADFAAAAPAMSDSADWRARHRSRHVPWAGWSAAAAVAVMCLGLGLWWGRGGFTPGAPNDPVGPSAVAVEPVIGNAGLDAAIAGATRLDPMRSDRSAADLDAILVRGDAAGDDRSATTSPLTDDARVFPALLVAATDLAALEQHLAAVAEPASATVTRNLTVETVAAAERASRRDAGGVANGQPLMAGDGAPADGRWNRAERDEMGDHLRDLIDDGPAVETGVVIAGPADGAAPFSDQVVLSLSGAQWTIAVRAADAPAVLAALHEAAGGATRLGMIDLIMQDLRSDDTSWADARGLLRAIADADPDRVIHLPVAAVADRD